MYREQIGSRCFHWRHDRVFRDESLFLQHLKHACRINFSGKDSLINNEKLNRACLKSQLLSLSLFFCFADGLLSLFFSNFTRCYAKSNPISLLLLYSATDKVTLGKRCLKQYSGKAHLTVKISLYTDRGKLSWQLAAHTKAMKAWLPTNGDYINLTLHSPKYLK